MGQGGWGLLWLEASEGGALAGWGVGVMVGGSVGISALVLLSDSCTNQIYEPCSGDEEEGLVQPSTIQPQQCAAVLCGRM